MVFAHDTNMSLQAAVVLANSALAPDTLTTVAELDAFYVEFAYTGTHDGDAAELEEVRALRGPLRELLTADRDTAVLLVNRTLAERDARPRLVRHDGWDYHLHATDPAAPLADQIAVETAMAMVDVIRADEMARLSICADDTCEGVVVDLSRNRSRRFCSTACTNRVAAAAYRARRSG
ncbi:CGNR zinc finger domain-containing protein [Pseudonocardia abyssalis]|uniref:CGNR zinc finger domain-containing protein n=1 Tax=Pseudonocardia abyssalis TaxID=2792008 RepID=A0ABS6UWR0_9PSEU|nr:CGNR zinc finger domain-containing protein [Pseudonocardia abyssalis]MBW0116689.1 CGNR zinc finger domain-containing protein [Pseudonocardia abyssalis]MBW0136607.1 CGNR zinc finger domain-containing protein [Pseudonocardia abyssalis]